MQTTDPPTLPSLYSDDNQADYNLTRVGHRISGQEKDKWLYQFAVQQWFFQRNKFPQWSSYLKHWGKTNAHKNCNRQSNHQQNPFHFVLTMKSHTFTKQNVNRMKHSFKVNTTWTLTRVRMKHAAHRFRNPARIGSKCFADVAWSQVRTVKTKSSRKKIWLNRHPPSLAVNRLWQKGLTTQPKYHTWCNYPYGTLLSRNKHQRNKRYWHTDTGMTSHIKSHCHFFSCNATESKCDFLHHWQQEQKDIKHCGWVKYFELQNVSTKRSPVVNGACHSHTVATLWSPNTEACERPTMRSCSLFADSGIRHESSSLTHDSLHSHAQVSP